MFGKKGAAVPLGTLAILAILVVGFLVWQNSNSGGGGLAQVPGVSGGNSGSGGVVITDSSVTVTFSAVDKYDQNIRCLGNHQYSIQGSDGTWNPFVAVANDGTASLGPGTPIRIAWCDANSTAGVTRSFIDVKQTVVGNKATTISFKEAVRNGSLTTRFYNENNDRIQGTTNYTFGAGDVKTVNGDIESQFERGMPHGGIAVVEFNGSAYDLEGMALTIDGQRKAVPVPTFYSLANANNKAKAYEVPVILSSGTHQFQVQVDVDDTYNPNTGLGDNIIVTVYPKNWDFNSETGDYRLGVEDENGAAISPAPTSTTINVN